MKRLATIIALGFGFYACQTMGIPPGGAASDGYDAAIQAFCTKAVARGGFATVEACAKEMRVALANIAEIDDQCTMKGLAPDSDAHKRCVGKAARAWVKARWPTNETRPPLVDCERPEGGSWVMHPQSCTRTGGRIIRR